MINVEVDELLFSDKVKTVTLEKTEDGKVLIKVSLVNFQLVKFKESTLRRAVTKAKLAVKKKKIK